MANGLRFAGSLCHKLEQYSRDTMCGDPGIEPLKPNFSELRKLCLDGVLVQL